MDLRSKDYAPPLTPDYTDTLDVLGEWRSVINAKGPTLGISALEMSELDLKLSKAIHALSRRDTLDDMPEIQSSESQSKLLVVDDDSEFLQEITHFLGEHGYTCFAAESVSDAVASLSSFRPSIILIDNILPDGSGLQFVDRAASIPEGEDCVFLMMSGQATVNSVVQALRRRVADYLTKPIEIPELLSALRSANRLAKSRNAFAKNATALEADLLNVDASISSLQRQLTKLLGPGDTVGDLSP